MGIAQKNKMRYLQKNLNSLKIEINKEEITKERLKQIALTLHETLMNAVKEILRKR